MARSDTDRRDNLQLPRGNPRTVEFARERKSRAASDRAFIAEVLDWFRKESFVYTLAPPLLEGDTVDAFLFDTRRGFCEHYAGADDHGPAAQSWVVALLHRRIEGVEVGVEDGRRRHEHMFA